MGNTKNGIRYPEEMRARAVQKVLDHESENASRLAVTVVELDPIKLVHSAIEVLGV